MTLKFQNVDNSQNSLSDNISIGCHYAFLNFNDRKFTLIYVMWRYLFYFLHHSYQWCTIDDTIEMLTLIWAAMKYLDQHVHWVWLWDEVFRSTCPSGVVI